MSNSRKRIFITGAAGFIGSYLAQHLHTRGDFVIGCDNFNTYYDPELKKMRAEALPCKVLNCDFTDIAHALDKHQITHVVHLAAQAGVRYSLLHPEKYQETNSNSFFQLLEILKDRPHIKFTFASSSSVYGLNKKIPFSESDPTDHPANFYGATKKANEVMAFSYHHLYGIATTALRFFTVYGPMGRPDMAYFFFTNAIQNGKTIRLFNKGNMRRDFTYIDDIVEGTTAAIDRESSFEIFNLGNNQPEELMTMVQLIEEHLGKKAKLELLPMQPGEIEITYANIDKAKKLLGFSPKTSLEEGMKKFLTWHQETQPDIVALC